MFSGKENPRKRKMDNFLVQIFERKRRIVEQVKQHVDLFDKHLAFKCLLAGVSPPSWLWSSSLPARTSELNKEEIISEFLLPPSRLSIICPGSRPFSYQRPVSFLADNVVRKGLPSVINNPLEEQLCEEEPQDNLTHSLVRRVSNHSQEQDGTNIASPRDVHETERVPNSFLISCRENQCCPSAEHSQNQRVETNLDVISPGCSQGKKVLKTVSTTGCERESSPPRYFQDETEPNNFLDTGLSLAKMQRSRSRQKALELRSSAKASKSLTNSRDELKHSLVGYTGFEIASLRSDSLSEIKLFNHDENNEGCGEEVETKNSQGKGGDQCIKVGLATETFTLHQKVDSAQNSLSGDAYASIVTASLRESGLVNEVDALESIETTDEVSAKVDELVDDPQSRSCNETAYIDGGTKCKSSSHDTSKRRQSSSGNAYAASIVPESLLESGHVNEINVLQSTNTTDEVPAKVDELVDNPQSRGCSETAYIDGDTKCKCSSQDSSKRKQSSSGAHSASILPESLLESGHVNAMDILQSTNTIDEVSDKVDELVDELVDDPQSRNCNGTAYNDGGPKCKSSSHDSSKRKQSSSGDACAASIIPESLLDSGHVNEMNILQSINTTDEVSAKVDELVDDPQSRSCNKTAYIDEDTKSKYSSQDSSKRKQSLSGQAYAASVVPESLLESVHVNVMDILQSINTIDEVSVKVDELVDDPQSRSCIETAYIDGGPISKSSTQGSSKRRQSSSGDVYASVVPESLLESGHVKELHILQSANAIGEVFTKVDELVDDPQSKSCNEKAYTDGDTKSKCLSQDSSQWKQSSIGDAYVSIVQEYLLESGHVNEMDILQSINTMDKMSAKVDELVDDLQSGRCNESAYLDGSTRSKTPRQGSSKRKDQKSSNSFSDAGTNEPPESNRFTGHIDALTKRPQHATSSDNGVPPINRDVTCTATGESQDPESSIQDPFCSSYYMGGSQLQSKRRRTLEKTTSKVLSSSREGDIVDSDSVRETVVRHREEAACHNLNNFDIELQKMIGSASSDHYGVDLQKMIGSENTNFLPYAGETSHPLASCIVPDSDDSPCLPRFGLISSDDVSPPVMEGFIMQSDDENQSGSKYHMNHDIFQILRTTAESAVMIEQACKTSPSLHPAKTFKFDRQLDLNRSVSTELFDGMIFAQNVEGSSVYDNLEINHDYTERLYTDSLPLSGASSSAETWNPCTSPPEKLLYRSLQKSLSSEKRGSRTPDLPCISEENEYVEKEAEKLCTNTPNSMRLEKRGSSVLDLPCIAEENENIDEISEAENETSRSKRENVCAESKPLGDVDEDPTKFLPSISEAKILVDRQSLDSVNTAFSFSYKCNSVQSKVGKQNNQRFTAKGKEDQGGAGAIRNVKPPISRFSKPKLSCNSSLTGPRLPENEPRHNNIVSNITSFVPLVQQQKPTGKRDVRVKALEAAQASKRIAEQKENDRKLKKEAMKLERARQEQENLIKQKIEKKKKEEDQKKKEAERAWMQEMEKKKKEEERKRKEFEMANRKRQREEEDKKLKEAKRQRIVEIQRQQREADERLQAEREFKSQSMDVRIKAQKELKEDQSKTEKTRGPVNNMNPAMRSKSNSNDDTNASRSSKDNDLKVISNPEKMSEETNIGIEEMRDSYEISPHKCSDDEDEDDDYDNMSNKKFVPAWASKNNVLLAVLSQQNLDSSIMFPANSFCDKSKVLLPRKFQLRIG